MNYLYIYAKLKAEKIKTNYSSHKSFVKLWDSPEGCPLGRQDAYPEENFMNQIGWLYLAN